MERNYQNWSGGQPDLRKKTYTKKFSEYSVDLFHIHGVAREKFNARDYPVHQTLHREVLWHPSASVRVMDYTHHGAQARGHALSENKDVVSSAVQHHMDPD